MKIETAKRTTKTTTVRAKAPVKTKPTARRPVTTKQAPAAKPTAPKKAVLKIAEADPVVKAKSPDNLKPTKVRLIRTLKAGHVSNVEKVENASNYEEAKSIRDDWAREFESATRLKKAKFYVRFELPDSFVSIRIFRHREPRKKNAA